jgi:hypothetical protein
MDGTLATVLDNCVEAARRAVEWRGDGRPKYQRDGSTEPVFYKVDENTIATRPDLAHRLRLRADILLAPTDRQALCAAIEAGRTTLVEVTLSSWDREDGDGVAIVSDQVTINVKLRHAPQDVVIAITVGKLTMVGVYNGGGGFTAKIDTGKCLTPLSPSMAVGERIEVPFLGN